MSKLEILNGDALAVLKTLPDESVNCCVTSPPYWGLRDYGCEGQIGLEATPEEFIGKLVKVFREVRRVLRKDGTAWVNLGDTYATGAGKVGESPGGGEQGLKWKGSRGGHEGKHSYSQNARGTGALTQPNRLPIQGLKAKDIVGIPWRFAFAAQADGWYLRQDIIWHKPNPMPESVTDRCTKSHEYIFLLTKSEKYSFDHQAIYEGLAAASISRLGQPNLEKQKGSGRVPGKTNGLMKAVGGQRKRGVAATHQHLVTNHLHLDIAARGQGRNKRSVWTVPTIPYSAAHFATYPPDLIKPCILAGCPVGGVVLDPFGGSGTTGQVALELGRSAILIELNPNYIPLIERRCSVTLGLALSSGQCT